MGEQTYCYDAFISYRHLPLDKAVAVRLQELLESFKPPKGLGEDRKIRRIFRDQSELPTSGDLGADIHEALMSSRYLIVICTEKTKESVWCMEEIRQFKEAHNGQTGHILVVTASGEPTEVFPEALLTERVPVVQEDGTTLWQERIVEPLCCDVRTESTHKSLKRLKTEFLRVAAPLIGCRYDDLYQRHRRRARRRLALLTGSAFVLLTGVLSIVSVFAYRTYLSEKNFRQTLAETYTRQGAGWMEEGKLQEALLYHTSALTLGPEDQKAARLGAALLLEQNAWPCLVREEPGAILEDTVCLSPPDGYLLALDRSGSRALTQLADGYGIWEDGEPVDIVPEGMGTFLRSSVKGDYWVFCGDEYIFFYRTVDGDIRAIPRPTKVQAACEADAMPDTMPTALPVADDQAVAVYGGYVYLYDLEDDPLKEKVCVDLALIFAQEGQEDYLDAEGQLWVSEDGSLAVVASGFGIAAFNTADLSLKASCLRYHYILDHVAISRDGAFFALVYGNPFGVSNTDPGGYLEVFDRYGELVLKTPIDPETPYEGAVFDPDDPDRLLAWSRDSLHFWDVAAGKEYAVPLKKEGILCAAFGEDAHCILYDGEGMLQAYDLLAFTALGRGDGTSPAAQPADPDRSANGQAAGSGQADAQAAAITQDGYAQAVTLPDGLIAAHNYTRFCLLDGSQDGQADGPAILEEVRLEDPVNRMMAPAGGQEVYLFARWGSCLYRADLPASREKPLTLTRLDTRGQLLTELYPLQEGIAAVTGTGQVLFYRPESQSPKRSLQLEHSGTVLDLTETGAGCLAVRIRSTESALDSYRYDTSETTELWDLASGIHIADLDGNLFERPEDLAFRDIPVPDAETLAFLAGLTCCTLDDAQNILSKVPDPDPSELGSWGSILSVRTISGRRAEDDTDGRTGDGPGDGVGNVPGGRTGGGSGEGVGEGSGDHAKNGSGDPSKNGSGNGADDGSGAPAGAGGAGPLGSGDGTTGKAGSSLEAVTAGQKDLAEDTDPEKWLAETDALWEKLEDHGIAFSITELDTWFRLYWHNAQKLDCLDRIEKGVSSYLALGGENEISGASSEGRFDGYLLEMAAETTDYDQIIAAGFIDLADRLEAVNGTAAAMTTDTDRQTQEGTGTGRSAQTNIGAGSSAQTDAGTGSSAQTDAGAGSSAQTDAGAGSSAQTDAGTGSSAQASTYMQELEAAVRQYEIWYLRTYGRLLMGKDDGGEIFGDVDKARGKGLLSAEAAELKILEQLWKGDGAAAADYAREDIQSSLDLDIDLYLLEYTWKYSLLGQYALAKRQVIQAEAFEDYIHALPAHMGLEITEASPQALEAGLRIDDLILSANDHPISCLIQAQELFAPDGILRLEILREGKVVDLDMDARTKFSARFRIRFDG